MYCVFESPAGRADPADMKGYLGTMLKLRKKLIAALIAVMLLLTAAAQAAPTPTPAPTLPPFDQSVPPYDSAHPENLTADQLYAQAFAIYGLSELYKVTRDDEALKNAINIFKVVETYFADKENGGYIEALNRDFSPLSDMSLSEHDINADKTMNSHLHLLEAYANLYGVWKDDILKEALESLISLMVDRITGPDGHLRLYFRNDWTVLPGAVSYGHDIETSWLILECASVLDDPKLTDRVRRCSLALGRAGNEGILEDGSMMYELMPDGSRDLSRQWWVQAETVVGNLWLWKYHGDADGLHRAVRCWDWIRDNLVDRDRGEWFWGTDPDGNPDLASPKAGFWKCPYHNTRMCLEVLKLFRI